MNRRQLGMCFLNQGALGRAEEHLRAWVSEHPEDVAAHMELVWCFRRRAHPRVNTWAKCDEFYRESTSPSSSSALRRFVRAEQLHHEDRQGEAVDEYRTAIEAGLDAPATRYGLGRSLAELGKLSEASAEYRAACEMDTSFVPAANAYMRLLFSDGRLDLVERVRESLKSLEDADPDLTFRGGRSDMEDITNLARAASAVREAVSLTRREAFEEAAVGLLRTWRTYRTDPLLLRTLAYVLYRCGWLPFAERILACEMPGDSPESAFAQGLVCWYKDECERAIDLYSTAIDNGFAHPLVLVARAMVYEHMNMVQREEEDLERAYARQPWLAWVRRELAENAFEKSEFRRVIALADLARDERELALTYDVAGQTRVASLGRLRLRSLMKMGCSEEAAKQVEEDALPCEDADLMIARCAVCADVGRLTAACGELDRAVVLDESVLGRLDEGDVDRIRRIAEAVPDSCAAAFCLSLLLAYANQYSEAIGQLEAVAARHADQAHLWYHVGNLSWILGERSRAKEALRRALSLDPMDQRALGSLSAILKEEGDLDGLVELSESVPERDLPLAYAMDVASAQGQPERAKKIGEAARKDGHAGVEVLRCLLPLTEGVEDAFASVLHALTHLVPVDYAGREYVARHRLQAGEYGESVEEYAALLSDGEGSSSAVLGFGLGLLFVDRIPDSV